MEITVITPRCMFCGQQGEVRAPARGVQRWQDGELIQRALPELTAEQREQLINGTHPKCWDEMMGDEE